MATAFMPICITPITAFGLPRTTTLLNQGFADYIVPIAFTGNALPVMVRRDQLDLAASVVLLRDDDPVGVALIARRDTTCRLAGMCFVPSARGAGLGRLLLDHVVRAARTRGDRAMVLEVISQNEPAVRLYRGAGFAPVRQLVGFRATPWDDVPPPQDVAVVGVASFAARAAAGEMADIPWQISAATLATVDPARATACFVAGLAALVGELPENRRLIRGLVPTDDVESDVAALRAVRAHWSDAAWQVGALMPEEWTTRFAGAGFSPIEQTQTQMRLLL